MVIYHATRTIKHGWPDGTVTVYKPGDEVPEELAAVIPDLVQATSIPNAALLKPEKNLAQKSPSQMNTDELKAKCEELGIDCSQCKKADDMRNLIREKLGIKVTKKE